MFCKHCGKEIKDGVSFCPACGKPTGVQQTEGKKNAKKNNPFQNKKPNLKLLLAVLGVAVVFLVIGGIGKKLSSNDSQDVAVSDSGASSEEYTEEGQSDYNDKKWKKKKSYKQAYKEEYDSFEARIEEYCQQKNIEYSEMVDKVADGMNEAYESLQKEVPDLSTYIGLDVGTAVSNSYTGIGIVSTLTEKALDNEEVRKIGFKALTYAGTSLFDYAMNYTTTDYPFGFEVIALNENYALLRSNGTYEDMQKIIRNSIAYDTKVSMLGERISELESEAASLKTEEDEDAYAECLGRLAANKDRENEVKELYNKCMTTIACSGKGYCLEGSQSIKLYWVVGKDGTVSNTFWAPSTVRAESGTFDISIGSNGSCLLEEDSTGRFVIDSNGELLFDGNSFVQREEESVGESIICTYGPGGDILRETKVKDSTYGTYYTIEVVNSKGKAKKVLDVSRIKTKGTIDRETHDGRPNSGYEYQGSYYNGIAWGDDMVCSDYTLLTYETLENQEEEIVIQLSTGETYSKDKIEKPALENASKEEDDNHATAQKGELKDGWLWNAENGNIRIQNSSVNMEFLSGHSDTYSTPEEFDTHHFSFDADAFKNSIDESRKIAGCYRTDNVLWIVTKSGYFYTYDLENKDKTKEIEIGENTPYAFTPYGLLVYDKNGKDKAKVEHESTTGKETEYSVYQYDDSGKCIAEYPAYFDSVSNLYDDIFGFLYCNGADTYNLATNEVFSME